MKGSLPIQKLKSENESLRKELARCVQELTFFIDSSKAFTSTQEFNKILRVMMERVQRLIKCETWSLFLLDEEKKELKFVLVKGGYRSESKKPHIKIGKGIAGWVAKKGRPVIVQDVRKNLHFYKPVDQIARFKTRSVLCVPIINNMKTIGVIQLINKRSGVPFKEKDKELLVQLVGQAATALERSSLYQQMANLAITDDLTKLFNFRHLYQTLDREISRCKRYGSALSLIFLDMDYFKLINDNHGHLVGSRVLIEVAQILVNNLRNFDVIARYGGDEFVVVLPETYVKTAARITFRLQRAFQENEFLKEEGLNIRITASFGISGYPEHATTKNDMILLADRAMYRAKNTGRNRICIAEPITKTDQSIFRDSSFDGISSPSSVVKRRSPRRSSRRSATS